MGVGKNNHAAHILANTGELLFGIKKRAKHKRGWSAGQSTHLDILYNNGLNAEVKWR
jgi:hypothetical protein